MLSICPDLLGALASFPNSCIRNHYSQWGLRFCADATCDSFIPAATSRGKRKPPSTDAKKITSLPCVSKDNTVFADCVEGYTGELTNLELESTALGTAEFADCCGFGDEANFRNALWYAFGINQCVWAMFH